MTTSDTSTPYSAQVYDNQVKNTIPYYDEFHTETVKIVKAVCIYPKTWLDTGCGTGSLVQKATTEFPDTHFVLVDPSPQMLDAAKKKLERQVAAKIQFLQPNPTEKLDNLTDCLRFHVISCLLVAASFCLIVLCFLFCA